MKIIKCKLCAGAWAIIDADLERQSVCPYCGASIRGEIEFSEYDSLDKAIYGAISKMGKDILQKPRQLVGFLMDTAPELKKEIRIFAKTVNENYVAYIRCAFEQEINVAETTINNKLYRLFVGEEGLSDSWADTICKGLYGAVLFSKGIGTSRLINVEIVDFEENNQSEIEKQLNYIKKISSMDFYDIKNKLEDKKFKNMRNGEMQNGFEIFMNNYHLLENGVRHIDFANGTGFAMLDFICLVFYQLNLVIKDKNSPKGVQNDFFKISELGAAFYKTFAE